MSLPYTSSCMCQNELNEIKMQKFFLIEAHLVFKRFEVEKEVSVSFKISY